MDLQNEIAKVAYELYEKTGRIDGRDMENWLEAEKIVKSRHAKKELATAVKQIEEAAEEVVQKAKEAVQETIQGLSTVTKKVIKKGKFK